MAMAAPQKFLFDRSFDLPDPPRAIPRKPPPPAAPPPEPTFSKAELEAARAADIAEGRETAMAEAARSAEERTAAALSAIAAGVGQLISTQQRTTEEIQRRGVETLRMIVQKTVPALAKKAPLVEVEALLADCLREAFDEPRVVLRVADAIFESVQARLQAITAATGFAGKLVLLADETLGPGDARVEWSEGGAERDTRRLLHDFDGALSRALNTLTVAAAKPLEENEHE
jgi:flagellar assembly protein FliH